MAGGFNAAFSSAQCGGFGGGFISPPPIISSGLVLQYDISNFNSYPAGGNTVTDIVGNSNATLYNSPSYSTNYIEFNGTNQYLMTNTSLKNKVTTDITTISMWAYPMDNGVLLCERGSASLSSIWHDSQMEMTAGTMKFGMWNGLAISYATSTIATPINNWYFFTMVYDGTTLTAYVNDQQAGTATFSRTNPIEGGTEIFYSIAAGDVTNMGDGTYANMRLGAFHIYNIALSAGQVASNYRTTRYKYGI